MDLLSRLDALEIGRTYVLSRAQRITPELVDVEGSDVNLFVGSMSFCTAAVSRQLGDRTAALLLDGAEGEDLDRWGMDRYQEPRKGAAAAVGRVRMFRSTTAAGAGSVPVGTKVITLGGVEYITTSQATFAAAELGDTVNGPFADVRAVQAGTAFQVGRDQIRRFDQVTSLFDKTLQITNDDPTAGGAERESDPVFRERLRVFWLTARRGVLSAIERGALSVPGVESAQASEALTPGGQPARVVNLYIADASGVANLVLAAQVAEALREFRAGGIAVIISTSIPQIVALKLKLQFAASVNTAALTVAIRAALFEFINSLPVNGRLDRGDLFSVLRRFKSDGLLVPQDSIVEPTGDLVPAVGSTLRIRLQDITVV